MYLSLNKLTSKYGQIVVLILYIHSLKLQESQSHHFTISFLAVFSLVVMQRISSITL